MGYYTPTCRPLEAPPEHPCRDCERMECRCDDAARCDWCAADTDNGAADCGDVVCDRCLVANAHACGDWCNDSIAAHRRLFPDPSTC